MSGPRVRRPCAAPQLRAPGLRAPRLQARRRRLRFTRPLVCAALIVLAPAARAAEAPAARDRHLGVASCATSVCHGKLAPQAGRNVALNEYRIWLQEDRHARAYRTLESPASRRIAAKLGLPSAAAAPICLDCHADNVPAAQRGPRFQIRDGVGCEACHGGAERWIESHAAEAATHRENLARGMYPTEQPVPRAQLCLSCHLGTRDRFATHAIMGAGHPRLSFELEAFTTNQPAHYEVDADYRERKGRIEGVNLWLTGQLESARRYLALLQSATFSGTGMFPELAFYDCHGCHHPMDDLRWTPGRAGPGVRPGAPRLQRQHLLTLRAAAESLGAPAAARELGEASAALVRAGHMSAAQMRTVAAQLTRWVDAQESWTTRRFTPAEVARLRRALLQYAANDEASDFGAAEQVVLGVESLSYSLGDRERHKAALDALYGAVERERDFSPARFADVARRVQGRF